MLYIVLPLIGLLLGFLGAYIPLKMRFQRLLTADNKAKILGVAEKRALEKDGERVVKLDFESLLQDMELKYKLWQGKHQKWLGIYINWTKSILAKDINTRRN